MVLTNEEAFGVYGVALLAGLAECGHAFEQVCAQEEVLAIVAASTEGNGEGHRLVALRVVLAEPQLGDVLLFGQFLQLLRLAVLVDYACPLRL